MQLTHRARIFRAVLGRESGWNKVSSPVTRKELRCATQYYWDTQVTSTNLCKITISGFISKCLERGTWDTELDKCVCSLGYVTNFKINIDTSSISPKKEILTRLKHFLFWNFRYEGDRCEIRRTNCPYSVSTDWNKPVGKCTNHGEVGRSLVRSMFLRHEFYVLKWLPITLR